MKKQDSLEPEGHEPTEEVGAEECAPGAHQCEVKSGDLEEGADASHPSFMEEIQDAYVPEPGLMVPSLEDGLPIPADETNVPQTAPPFTIDNVVCVEDDREWVEVFEEEAIELGILCKSTSGGITVCAALVGTENKHGMRVIVRSMYGKYFTKSLNQRVRFTHSSVIDVYGIKFARVDGAIKASIDVTPDARPGMPWWYNTYKHYGEGYGSGEEGAILVRPIRERCKHYKRQAISNDDKPDQNEFGHTIIFRNCMVRRSVGGAFMSLRDEAIYACDYRDPPDSVSAKKYLDDPDRERLRSEAHKVKLPLFRSG